MAEFMKHYEVLLTKAKVDLKAAKNLYAEEGYKQSLLINYYILNRRRNFGKCFNLFITDLVSGGQTYTKFVPSRLQLLDINR